jgi:hypothetical protein
MLRSQLGKEKDMLPLKIIAITIAFISLGIIVISWLRIPEAKKNQRGLIFAGGLICVVITLLMLYGPI